MQWSDHRGDDEENPAMAMDQDKGSDTEADMEPINDDLIDEPDD